MAKNLLKFVETQFNEDSYQITPPDFKQMVVEEELDEVLEGKGIEELRAERDAYEAEFENYKSEKESEAHMLAEEIIEKAKAEAFEILKKKNNEAQEVKQKAEDEAEEIIKKAHLNAKEIEDDIQEKEQKILNDARRRGYQDGWDEGVAKGEAEVKRLIDRIQVILNATIEKRNDVFVETEQQVIGLVLLIPKKVIKVISDQKILVVIMLFKHNANLNLVVKLLLSEPC